MMARLYFFFLVRQKDIAVMTSSERTAIVTPEKVEGKFRSLPGKKDNERARGKSELCNGVRAAAAAVRLVRRVSPMPDWP